MAVVTRSCQVWHNDIVRLVRKVAIMGDENQSTMNHRERVVASIRHRVPDRIPFGELVVPDGLVERALGIKPRDENTRRCVKKEFLEDLGMDLVVVDASRGSAGEEANIGPSLISEVKFWATESDFFVFVLFEGGFTETLNTLGWYRFFKILAKCPTEVAHYISKSCMRLESRALEVVQAGADGIIVGDDIAYQKGLLLNPQLLREILWEPLSETINRIKKEKQCPVFFHSEGNIWQALPDIVAVGFDGVHSLEPSAGMDLQEVRKVFGDKLCLMGNLELEYLLSRGETELIREVIGILETAGNGAGFIFSTTSGLIDEVDVGKLRRMCDLVTSRQPKR